MTSGDKTGNEHDRTVLPARGSGSLSRRALLQGSAGVAAAYTFPMINRDQYKVFAASQKRFSSRVVDLVRSSHAVDLKHALTLHPDVLMSWLKNPKAFDEESRAAFRRSGLKVIQTTLETVPDAMLDFAWHNGFVATNSDLFHRVFTFDDIAYAERTNRIAIIFGCENSTHFQTVDDVDKYYSLGQRVSQLTYNAQNLLGAGSTERVDGGLSDFGAAIVSRMNRIGMAVDLSHCGPRTTLDAIEASTGPAFFTHANVRALNPSHPRMKSDEAIQKLAAKGGVMGVAFLRVFATETEPTTIEHVLDHYDHVRKLVGIEHLAVGSDIALYGYDSLPRALVEASKANLKKGTYRFRENDDIEGLNYPERLFDLTEGLVRRGYGESDIRAILGGNALRVLNEAWRPNI